ncbi:MAG: hypothetical protein HY821_06240 [Acidobacteria bacterium]|nr:hypothetical protein [Acidobacteriota bacterium]
MNLQFRTALPEDLGAIRRLNHSAFAAELGQHQTTEDGLLADAREGVSRYFVAVYAGRVVGMVCASFERPFSVESRLEDAAILEALPARVCEVRLLTIEREHRNTLVIAGLLTCMFRDIVRAGAACLVISGVTTRVPMYERMGFRALGPAVPQGNAAFVPMVLRLADLPPQIRRGIERF